MILGGVGPDPLTELLAHMDGADGGTTFLDSSKNALAITPTTTATSATQTKFGATSAYFGAARSSVLAVTDNAAIRLQSAYTVDFWTYLGDVTTVQTLAGKVDSVSSFGPLQIFVASGSILYFISSNNSSWNIASGVSMGAISVNTWTHVAMVWDGSTYRPFVGGVAGTTTSSGTAGHSNTSPFAIGAASSPTGVNAIGYIDEFRISSTARWTSGFTPPTGPYV